MLVSSGLVSSAVELLIVFLVSVIVFFYAYYQYCFTYWKKKGLPQANPTFPTGDLAAAAFGRKSVFLRIEELYNEFKAKGIKNAGLYYFNGPIYFPVHPEMVKRVMVTDFNYFVDRGMYMDKDKIPLSYHMFSMNGEEWRSIRTKFTPTFTSGKMKNMYNILLHCTENLIKTLEPHADNGETINIKQILTRFTTDVIGSCAFGIDCNSLVEPDTDFVKMVEKIFHPPTWRLLKVALEEGPQNPGNLIKVTHEDAKVQQFFIDLVRDTIKYRDENKIKRDDFLNILMQMRDSEEGMSFNAIVAQAFLFFTAGFETSSATMSSCLHQLCQNQDLQEELRNEIQDTLGTDSAKYTYEDILGLPLLDRTIKETLRKYPPVGLLNRICVKDYKIPDSDVVIEKGTPVIISVLGLHRDPEYFPDPMKFDPERFNGEKKIVPYSYLPFGDGPRNCIGLRFGLMQTKLGMATLLNHFRFLPSLLTTEEIEIDPTTTTIVMNVKDESIFVKILKS